VIRTLAARLSPVRESPDFGLLFYAALASGAGTWLAFIALVVDVTDRTGDARWVSALLIAEFLPLAVAGLLIGPLVDRFSRRRILVAADLVRALVFVVLPFAPSALAIVGLAFVAGIATSFFRPAAYAGLPNLVSPERLPRANGLLQSADNLTWAVGALVGGAVVAVSGPDAAYAINALSFVVSAVLLLRIRASLEEPEREPSRGHFRDLAAGISLVLHRRPLYTVLAAWSLVMLANAGVNVGEIFLARDVFNAGDFGFGYLAAAGAAGLVVGSLGGGAVIERYGTRGPYGLAIAIMGAGFLAAALSPNVWVAGVFALGAGIGNGAAVVCNAVLVQRGAPDALRGRAFSVLMSASYVVLGIGMLAAGPFINEYGARTAWAVAAGLCAAGAVTGFALLRSYSETLPAHVPSAVEERL
jgi:MFS family permease